LEDTVASQPKFTLTIAPSGRVLKVVKGHRGSLSLVKEGDQIVDPTLAWELTRSAGRDPLTVTVDAKTGDIEFDGKIVGKARDFSEVAAERPKCLPATLGSSEPNMPHGRK
jgi:hypothetical protein